MRTKHWIFVFLGAVTAFRLFYINTFPLLGDEAYYWQWARHLDMGYYEQGPVLALVIYICTLFTKINTLFTIRLGAVLLSLGTMIAAYFTYRNMEPADTDGRDSFLNIVLINSSLIYAIGAVLMMHDTVMVFFYSLFLYNFTNIIKEPENNMHWGHAGIILGAGIMSKLTLGVVYPGMLAFLLFTGTFRKYLKGFLYFTLFTLLLTSPYIFWNFTHCFATVKYLFIRGGSSGGFTLKYLGELIGAQILLVSPLLIALFVPAFMKSIKKPAFDVKFGFATLFWVSILPFIILSFKSRVEANWPAFTFFPLFFIATSYLSGLDKNAKKYISTGIVAAGFIFVAAALFLASFSYSLPEKVNPLRKSYGYKELAEKVFNVYNEFTSKKPGFLASRHYQTASLLSYYTPGQPEYYTVMQHESNKNYRFWKGYNAYKGGNCVFVYSEPWESAENALHFKKLVKTEKIEVKYGNYGTKTFMVDFLEGLK
jgi:4-amino-4-deoxy-L-arabinose transferase-like glycosyltransferase